jgi:hypothetical protein
MKPCSHGIAAGDWCGPCATARWAAMTPAARKRDQQRWGRKLAKKLRETLSEYVKFHKKGT